MKKTFAIREKEINDFLAVKPEEANETFKKYKKEVTELKDRFGIVTKDDGLGEIIEPKGG